MSKRGIGSYAPHFLFCSSLFSLLLGIYYVLTVIWHGHGMLVFILIALLHQEMWLHCVWLTTELVQFIRIRIILDKCDEYYVLNE